ncbi:hypothetical protein HYC85_028708 [Camellia sinensis]|uniref:Uncharacterized protein n=1 Tax=Camellia sinensis TaxID=4442 RepID=A0A7J7FWN1_CAMSI|nr:hypothetical protein HYC85_028708 [Camellia sinensis]
MGQKGYRVWEAQTCDVPPRQSSTQRAIELVVGCTCKHNQVLKTVKNGVSTVTKREY